MIKVISLLSRQSLFAVFSGRLSTIERFQLLEAFKQAVYVVFSFFFFNFTKALTQTNRVSGALTVSSLHTQSA